MVLYPATLGRFSPFALYSDSVFVPRRNFRYDAVPQLLARRKTALCERANKAVLRALEKRVLNSVRFALTYLCAARDERRDCECVIVYREDARRRHFSGIFRLSKYHARRR